MKAYSLMTIIFVCCICRYASAEIMSELKKNILNSGYGINFKCEGVLAHSVDRFYLFTKFILSTISDLKFLTIYFDETCDYLKEENGQLYIRCKILQPQMKDYLLENLVLI